MRVWREGENPGVMHFHPEHFCRTDISDRQHTEQDIESIVNLVENASSD